MRKLVLVEFLTVDGVMQGLGSPDEDTDGGFGHGGWGLPYAPAVREVVGATGPSRTSGFLLGRRTYDKMAAFWPHQPDSDPMAGQLNRLPKYVASRSPSELAWPGAEYLDGDLATAVPALKSRGDGDIVVLGSGVLVQDLMRGELVDELRLFVHPLVLGTGKRLFRELPAPRPLRLVSSRTTSAGTVALTYELVDG